MHTLYHGGPVITVNDEDQVADAVLVADGKFVAVGAYSDIKASAPSSEAGLDHSTPTSGPH